MNNVCSTYDVHTETETINGNETEDKVVDRVVKGKEKEKNSTAGKEQTIVERIVNCKAVFGDKDFIESAKKSYPDVVFERELAKMETWIRANPKKSNKSNWKRFVNTWLSQAEKEATKDGRHKQNAQGDRSEKLRAITKVVDV